MSSFLDGLDDVFVPRYYVDGHYENGYRSAHSTRRTAMKWAQRASFKHPNDHDVVHVDTGVVVARYHGGHRIR